MCSKYSGKVLVELDNSSKYLKKFQNKFLTLMKWKNYLLNTLDLFKYNFFKMISKEIGISNIKGNIIGNRYRQS